MKGTGFTQTQSMYKAVDLYALRAAVLPADTLPNLVEDCAEPFTRSENGADRRAGVAQLHELLRSARVRQALETASPSLAAALADLHDGRKDSERLRSSLLRYLTRMSTRPTPHGLFAGVAIGDFSSRTTAVMELDPVSGTRTRADGEWLSKIINTLENDRAIRDVLPVRVDDLTYRAGPFRVFHRTNPAKAGGLERIEISASAPLEAAIELARDNPLFGDLVTALAQRSAHTPETKVRHLLDQLWGLGILRSDLAAPPTEPLPDQHLAQRLSTLKIRPDLVDGLRHSRELSMQIDRAAGNADLDVIKRLSQHQRTLTPGFDGPTFQQDTALALGSSEMSSSIAEAAADAGEILMRLGCVRPRQPHIVEYHQVFLETYGVDSEVPLLEVIHPETGLGPPNEYQVPARRQPLQRMMQNFSTQRDDVLVDIAMTASRHQAQEVRLTSDQLEALAVWQPDDPHTRPRTSLDLFFQIAAESVEAIDAGDWQLAMSTVGFYGGWQSVGRFFDLFDDAVTDRIRAQQRDEERLRPETIFAELNYTPSMGRASNLISHPASRDFEICVNAAPSLPANRQISLDDVLLGADGSGFFLRSRSLGREVSVSQTHALNSMQAPNVCRALLEFSADRFSPQARFDWGVMNGAPHLPRLVWDKIVIHPARWLVTKATFSSEDLNATDFYDACQRWRREWKVPRHVYVSDHDHRLLLDLQHPLWVDELRREVERTVRAGAGSAVQMHEMLPGPEQLWLKDAHGRRYHSEVAVPLVLRSLENHTDKGKPSSVMSPTRRYLPGDDWLHLKLYAAAELHDAIIAGPLRSFLAESADSEQMDRWFFIRYADPLPHLRLRFHTQNPSTAALMAHCSAWARQLVAAGLATDFVFASYDRELERYGGGEAIDAVEDVFWQNSEVAAELVSIFGSRDLDLDAEIVAVMAMEALYAGFGTAPPSTSTQPDVKTRRDFRSIRALLCELLAPGEHRPDARAVGYVDAVSPVLACQQHSLETAGKRIRQLAAAGRLIGTERNVIDSLAHIQSIRLLGIDSEREKRCRHLYSLAQRAIRGRAASLHGSGTDSTKRRTDGINPRGT